ncbi:DUF6498-containing protein [Verrucomicrobiales bacterium BCK34]|nr:DUF6498-containing protein [Verrucomicrobiales bacterium BCK34]
MNPYASDSKIKSLSSSAAFLIAANLIPLIGAFFFNWDVLDIVLVYWGENFVVGFYAILRILTVKEGAVETSGLAAKIFFACFFFIHYGGFCAGHGVFVLSFFAPEVVGTREAMLLLTEGMKWTLPALFISHGYSFYHNYLGSGENARTRLGDEMFAPYPRLIVLHVAVIVGGFAVQKAGQPLYLLLILVLGKTYFDWKLHNKEHKKRAQPAS